MNFEISSDNPIVRSIIEGSAPRPAQIAAARGILPLPESDALEVLVAFARSNDEELARHARESLRSHDPELLANAASRDNVPVSVLDFFAGAEDLPVGVHESVISNPRTPVATLERIARSSTRADVIEFLAFNQQLLIQTPALIDAIAANPSSSAEARRRASETKREFVEKERGAQQIVSELRAQGKDAAAEFIENAEFSAEIGDSGMSVDDALFLASLIEVPDSETDDSWLGLEYLEEIYEETEADRARIAEKILGELRYEDGDVPNERISIINRIMKMGMRDRVKLAMKGDREARNILIRDPNRLVSAAVVGNPRLTEQEVEKIASMRTATEEILRGLANNRQWSKNYVIMHNLAKNPRTPIANVLTILTRLQARDLVALSKNRNVSDAVRRQALRLAQSRVGRT